MILGNEPADFLEEGGIFEHQQVGVEDAGILRAQALGHLTLHFENLMTGVDQRLFQAFEFAGHLPVGHPMSDDRFGVRLAQHENSSPANPRRSRDATEDFFSHSHRVWHGPLLQRQERVGKN